MFLCVVFLYDVVPIDLWKCTMTQRLPRFSRTQEERTGSLIGCFPILALNNHMDVAQANRPSGANATVVKVAEILCFVRLANWAFMAFFSRSQPTIRSLASVPKFTMPGLWSITPP